MLSLHGIEHTAIEIEPRNILSPDDLVSVRGEYTASLVNLGETSQGVLYDADLI